MDLHGVGPPLATPFETDGSIDEAALADLVGWMAPHVDFLVPCGSNSEAAKLTLDERTRVVDVVADAADVPVLAGTGTPGLAPTVAATRQAADAGADAALVVTPYYHHHDQATMLDYYRSVADVSPVPVYLYSVPAYTGVRLGPETVGSLAEHPNVAGMKDSSGDLSAFQRIRDRVPDDFDLLVGSGGVLAPALDAGGDGGVLALANVAPDGSAAVYDRHARGEDEAARGLNRALVELNHAVTAEYGIPGLKAAMRQRGAPAGRPRDPYRQLTDDELAHLDRLTAEAAAAIPE